MRLRIVIAVGMFVLNKNMCQFHRRRKNHQGRKEDQNKFLKMIHLPKNSGKTHSHQHVLFKGPEEFELSKKKAEENQEHLVKRKNQDQSERIVKKTSPYKIWTKVFTGHSDIL